MPGVRVQRTGGHTADHQIGRGGEAGGGVGAGAPHLIPRHHRIAEDLATARRGPAVVDGDAGPADRCTNRVGWRQPAKRPAGERGFQGLEVERRHSDRGELLRGGAPVHGEDAARGVKPERGGRRVVQESDGRRVGAYHPDEASGRLGVAGGDQAQGGLGIPCPRAGAREVQLVERIGVAYERHRASGRSRRDRQRAVQERAGEQGGVRREGSDQV